MNRETGSPSHPDIIPIRKTCREPAAPFKASAIVQQSAAQLPWFHIVTLITSMSDSNLRDWYAREALQRSWPRGTLALQIKNQLHLRQGAAATNFDERLAPPDAGWDVSFGSRWRATSSSSTCSSTTRV